HVQRLAPALQLDQAVGLAGGRPLGQGKAAGGREHPAIVAGLHLDAGAVSLGDPREPLVSEIGPGGVRGEVVLDPVHGVSSRQAAVQNGLTTTRMTTANSASTGASLKTRYQRWPRRLLPASKPRSRAPQARW